MLKNTNTRCTFSLVFFSLIKHVLGRWLISIQVVMLLCCNCFGSYMLSWLSFLVIYFSHWKLCKTMISSSLWNYTLPFWTKLGWSKYWRSFIKFLNFAEQKHYHCYNKKFFFLKTSQEVRQTERWTTWYFTSYFILPF